MSPVTDKSVTNFFTKMPEEAYIDTYDLQHGPRLDWTVNEFNLDSLHGKKILDVGGGMGFLGRRLPKDNDYVVVDAAVFPKEKLLCDGTWYNKDLDYEKFSKEILEMEGQFDFVLCLETLEHLTNPYNCLVEIKKLAKPNATIILSIPHISVTHNYIYPALMVDPNGFAQFLQQMALPIQKYSLWEKGWQAHHFVCSNADWVEARMLFPKSEPKFRGATPVEYVNA